MTWNSAHEGGNVTITSLIGMSVLSLFLALSIYVVSAYVSWSCMNHALEISSDTIMGTSFQMRLKSSTDPGREVAEKIASSFRASGYDERLVVWFCESNRDGLGDNVRAMSVTAQSAHLVTSGLSGEPLEIVCETSCCLVPYSSTQVFKPEADQCVLRYEFDSGSQTATETQTTFEDSPASLSANITRAEELALTY